MSLSLSLSAILCSSKRKWVWVKDREREFYTEPLQRRDTTIYLKGKVDVWRGPIMIWNVREEAGVHHLKFDDFSNTKGGCCTFKGFLNVDFWGNVKRIGATIIESKKKCKVDNSMQAMDNTLGLQRLRCDERSMHQIFTTLSYLLQYNWSPHVSLPYTVPI